MRLPCLGAFCCIRSEGRSFREDQQAYIVTAAVRTTRQTRTTATKAGLTLSCREGR